MEPEDDPEYWSIMDYSRHMKGKIQQAQKYYERPLQLDSANEGALNNLGSILSKQGKIEEVSDTCFTPQICTQAPEVSGLISILPWRKM